MFWAIILFIAASTVFAHGHKVHEQMTPDERQTVFGADYDSVPEYEIVPVAHAFHKKSNDHRIVQLTSFKQRMTLYLEPTDGYLAGSNTKVFTARSNPNSPSVVEYKRIPHAIKPNQIFQDIVNAAAFVIRHDDEGLALIDGIINDLAIRPLPERFRNQFKRNKRDVDNEFLQSNRSVYHTNFKPTHHHVVYKTRTVETKPNEPLTPIKKSEKFKFNKVPKVIHPQVLVVIESTLFNIFKNDVNSMVSYILSFWNGVDLRYRAFQHPHVRLNIAGIILAKDHNMTSYIANNHVDVPFYDDVKITVKEALRSKSQFFYSETFYHEKNHSMSMKKLGLEYDVVVTMSPYDMCQFKAKCLENGKYVCTAATKDTIKTECITLGLAYHKGACAYSANESVVEAVAIIEDKGGFGGIIPAAHEIGHLLGASHSSHSSTCKILDGYIMSYKLIISKKSFLWSSCSAQSIKNFYGERAQCLFNKPNIGDPVIRVLPGNVFSRDEQCDRIMGTYSCPDVAYSMDCERLYCAKSIYTLGCVSAPYTPVPEGTTCGNESYCLNAQCVRKSTKTIRLELGTEE